MKNLQGRSSAYSFDHSVLSFCRSENLSRPLKSQLVMTYTKSGSSSRSQSICKILSDATGTPSAIQPPGLRLLTVFWRANFAAHRAYLRRREGSAILMPQTSGSSPAISRSEIYGGFDTMKANFLLSFGSAHSPITQCTIWHWLLMPIG